MSKEYQAPGLVSLDFDPAAAAQGEPQESITLSGKDVLALVQAAYAHIGAGQGELTKAKEKVLAAVAAGRPAHALYLAILGAAQAIDSEEPPAAL